MDQLQLLSDLHNTNDVGFLPNKDILYQSTNQKIKVTNGLIDASIKYPLPEASKKSHQYPHIFSKDKNPAE